MRRKLANRPGAASSGEISRRHFLTTAVTASTAVAITSAAADAPPDVRRLPPVQASSKGKLPTGKIGKLTVSRLISGGNLISGWAHSRDLVYVPNLMRAYNTEEKVLDTLQLLEEHGVNAIIADPIKKPKEILSRYWKERGGKIQWIAEGHPDMDDWKTNLQQSIDFGAAAIYIQGVKADQFLKVGRLEFVAKCVDYIKSQGVPGGIGAHKLEVVMQSEKDRYGADFYVKTLHHTGYWSARRPDQSEDVVDCRTDNYWDLDPQRTIAFMQEIEKPWIAFKVLAAGAIRPESGFKYALENGADFLCVGMFDFQVEQNAALVRSLLPQFQNRERAWVS
jgi:hypothetical protein